MASSVVPSRKGGIGVPATLSFVLGTAGVVVVVLLAWAALTSDSVPIVASARNALIAVVVVGMTACAVAGIGQAPIIGWTHPITIFGIIVGVLALVIAAAGLFGWESILSPVSGLVPIASTVALTTERMAIGVLTALIVAKWLVGIPLAWLVSH